MCGGGDGCQHGRVEPAEGTLEALAGGRAKQHAQGHAVLLQQLQLLRLLLLVLLLLLLLLGRDSPGGLRAHRYCLALALLLVGVGVGVGVGVRVAGKRLLLLLLLQLLLPQLLLLLLLHLLLLLLLLLLLHLLLLLLLHLLLLLPLEEVKPVDTAVLLLLLLRPPLLLLLLLLRPPALHERLPTRRGSIRGGGPRLARPGPAGQLLLPCIYVRLGPCCARPLLLMQSRLLVWVGVLLLLLVIRVGGRRRGCSGGETVDGLEQRLAGGRLAGHRLEQRERAGRDLDADVVLHTPWPAWQSCRGGGYSGRGCSGAAPGPAAGRRQLAPR